jgi:lysozyme
MRVFLLCAMASAGCMGATSSHTEAATVCAAGAQVDGIDVSYYDGTIDWVQVYGAGKRFAIIRVSDGTGFIDPQFARNWTAARAAGIIRAPYQFFRASQDPMAQASLLLAQVEQAGGFQPGDLPPVMDMETNDGQSVTTVLANMRIWLAALEQARGRPPVIYTSARVWTTLANPTGFAQYPLWDANWGVMCPNLPPIWSKWTFWQSSASGNVPGISNSSMTDLDSFNGTLDDLKTFAGGESPLPDGGVADASHSPSIDGASPPPNFGNSAGMIAGGCSVVF